MDELSRIRHAHQAITIAEKELEDAVANAREAQYSWAEIGKILNISRQAAFKRFGTVTNPFTGEDMTPHTTHNLPELGEQFFRHLAAGDETNTMSMIHHGVRKDLPWTALTDVWQRVLGEIGDLESFDDTQVTGIRGTREKETISSTLMSKANGMKVVVTTLVHEAGEVMGRVAFDADQAVVGVLILPMETTDYPF